MRKKDLVGSYHDYVKLLYETTDHDDIDVIFVPQYNCTVKGIKAYFGTAAIAEGTDQGVLTAYYGAGTANVMGSVTIGTVSALGYAEVFSGNQECDSGTPIWMQYGTVGSGYALDTLLDIEYIEGKGRTAGTAMP